VDSSKEKLAKLTGDDIRLRQVPKESNIVQEVTSTQIKVNDTWYAKSVFKKEYKKGDFVPEIEAKPEAKKIIAKAKQGFGLTDDFKEAGYLLQDGSMLDFSGKKEGGTPGVRNYDHRQINEADTDMVGFMADGNIRMKAESNGFEITQKPTNKQLAVLKRYIATMNQGALVDFSEAGQYGATFSAEYNKGTPPQRIINDIANYYNNGVKPVAPDVRLKTTKLGLFSPTEAALSNIQQNKGTPEQWKAMLVLLKKIFRHGLILIRWR